METHILFFILAGLLLVILVGYTLWSARRDKSRIFSNTFSTRQPATPISKTLNIEVPDSLNNGSYAPQASEPAPYDLAAETEIATKPIRITLPGQEPQPPVTPVFASPEPVQPEPVYSPAPEPMVAPVAEPVAEASPSNEPEIISLYVVAPEGQQFYGATLYAQLDALGFQFGEYQIFHRHLDSSAASPVIFSVANMMQPGIFDLEKMEQFTTVGLVFFMHLPSVGNDVVNLRGMIRTVESFAQAVGGFVLDEQHQLFDEQRREQYLRRVAK